MASTKKSSKEEEEANKHKKKTSKEATQMASTTKSSKEEEEAKKHKKKTSKELKTSAKPTQLDSPKNKKKTSQELKPPTKPTQLDSPKNKNKTPEPLKNSPQQQRQQNDSKSSKPKKRNREEKDNEVGEDGSLCRFPMARIKRIMKSEDHDLGLGGDAVFLVNKATEMFLEKFCEDGYKWSVRDLKKSLNYNHLASVVSDKRRYDFLSDFVPEKLRADEALSRRKLVETEQG